MIDRSIEEGERLLSSAEVVHDSPTYEEWVHDVERWHARTRDALASSYEGDEAPTEFYESATGGIFTVWGQSPDEEFENRQKATRAALNTLRSLRERLEYAEVSTPIVPERTAPATAAVGSEVFLVHGHDEATKQTIARFLEHVTEQGVTILEEQPDRGRTIIEKFEDHAAEVGYAVVLVTGDDEGRKRGEEKMKPRARQNVVLELGFFIGRLGRGNVALLYEEGVDLPTDIDGVLYQPLDGAGAWKLKLAKELRAAGIPVDADAMLGA
jgi:predicted nucleotide-binding protein